MGVRIKLQIKNIKGICSKQELKITEQSATGVDRERMLLKGAREAKKKKKKRKMNSEAKEHIL